MWSTMEHYSAIEKNKFESAVVKWMYLEPVIQSEANRKRKHILCTNTYTWTLEKWY